MRLARFGTTLAASLLAAGTAEAAMTVSAGGCGCDAAPASSTVPFGLALVALVGASLRRKRVS